MYLYYDRYGTLKEQITFNPARVGNSNVNKIFVYWEGVEEFPDWAQELALQTRYLLQDNTQYPSATTFGFSAQPETAELPFDKNQDLKYFKYYKEYKFLTIDIPDEVLSYNGAVKSYIWVLNADKKRILGLGVFAFMVDGDINEVIPDENISLAQWNMIAAQLGLLSGSVIDVTCDIATNTLKVYYANGLTAIRNLPSNGAQTTISSDFLREMIFSADTWVQDGENGYYIYFRAETVGYNDNRFFVQLERDGNYESDYYNKTGSFVLSDNIFKGSDGSVLLYSNEPYSGRLLVVGGKLLSGDILVTGLTYNDVNSQLSYKTADGVTHTIYLGIDQKFDKSDITQTIGDSTVKVMSQKAVTDNFAHLVNGKVPESQLPSYVDDVVEYDSKSVFPATGETGKIYVDKSTNLTYRWSSNSNNYIMVGGGDLALENGTGTGSLVQKRLKSNGTTWTTAKAYQGAGTAFGGGTQAGRTEEEFNAYFWDSTNNIALNGGKGKDSQGNILDNNGLTYTKSYSYALAEGESTKALGRSSHAEGNATQSIGDHSHSEGLSTKAEGYAAHTEGAYTEAYYTGSHAEGNHTKTYAPYQHVSGTYNHYNINALYQVGNGTSDNDRKNAFEVLQDGRAKVQTAPKDNDDVVRKGDLANIGGGGDKLYLHVVPFKKSDNAITVNITFYSLSDQPTSDSMLIKIAQKHGLLFEGSNNMGMPIVGAFFPNSEVNFDSCDFYGINLVTGEIVEATGAKFIKQNETTTEI